MASLTVADATNKIDSRYTLFIGIDLIFLMINYTTKLKTQAYSINDLGHKNQNNHLKKTDVD